MADGAEQHGIEAAQVFDGGGGERLAGAQITVPAEIEGVGLVGDIPAPRDGVEHFERFRNDFGARAVPADHRNLVHSDPPERAGERAVPGRPRRAGAAPCAGAAPAAKRQV